jgi:hypothetical protein
MAQDDPDAQEFRSLLASIKNEAVRLIRRPTA